MYLITIIKFIFSSIYGSHICINVLGTIKYSSKIIFYAQLFVLCYLILYNIEYKIYYNILPTAVIL